VNQGYPRPQLRRAYWTSLDGPWRFCFDDERRFSSPGQIEHWPLQITVPFAPEAQASGLGDQRFHVACWYEREFECRPAGDRVILRFGAVDHAARVWVNGRLVATHEGGYTPSGATSPMRSTPRACRPSPSVSRTIRTT
jgi:beta-galactosidase/beta-glucuronidase